MYTSQIIIQQYNLNTYDTKLTALCSEYPLLSAWHKILCYSFDIFKTTYE
jgi:hypothetical protein